MFWRKAQRIRDLEERLREATEPKILEAHLQDGTIDLRLSAPVARIIAAFFWAMLEGKTTGEYAPNCVQFMVSDPNGHAIEVTARRAGGKMPNEIAAEAKQEADLNWRAGLLVARQSKTCPLREERVKECSGSGGADPVCCECRMAAAKEKLRREVGKA